MSQTGFLKILLPSIIIIYSLVIFFSTPVTNNYSYGSIFNQASLEKAQELRQSISEQISLVETNPQNILLTGDILLARHVETLLLKEGFNYPYQGVNYSDIIDKFYLVGNFESSIPPVHRRTKNFEMNFSVNKNLIPELMSSGFTHLSLANNHSFDHGQIGFDNTTAVLQQNNLITFGQPQKVSSSSITYLDISNYRVALIALETLSNSYSKVDLQALLTETDKNSSFQIIYIHWGDEYIEHSNQQQRNLALSLVEAGADLIVGHHPHVVQEVGFINNVPVFYSLGNYIFDQYFSESVQTGLVLNLDFEDDLRIKLLPVDSLSKLSQPALKTDGKKQEFLVNLAQKSSPELQPMILTGEISLNLSFATSSKIAIID